ncbi:MAG: aldo/keto reductase [Bacteriovorax sp.]|nr:aldo/keto reductase [Rhizobacter sp.]
MLICEHLTFGAAPIGNLYAEVDEAAAIAAVEAAYTAGIRSFDTAPYYGFGLSERRLGRALAGKPRGSFSVSTKVGRLLFDDTRSSGRVEGFAVDGVRARFDYSRGGILRSFEASLKRLGIDSVDVLLLHDIGQDTHGDQHAAVLRQALDEALPAMAELKASGACRAIGLGLNEEAAALQVLPHFDLDLVMLAGRYTLMEQDGSQALLAEAVARGIGILTAGPYNSGLLGPPDRPGTTYNYGEPDPATLRRAQCFYDVCARHGVDIGAAALQFPLAHPAVRSVVVGLRTAAEVETSVRRFRAEIPAALWAALKREGLLSADACTP